MIRAVLNDMRDVGTAFSEVTMLTMSTFELEGRNSATQSVVSLVS